MYLGTGTVTMWVMEDQPLPVFKDSPPVVGLPPGC